MILKCGEEKSKPVDETMMLPFFTETELTATWAPRPPEEVSDTVSALAAAFTFVRPHNKAASDPGIKAW